MKADRITYKDLFETAKDVSRAPGSQLGAKTRDTVQSVNAMAKASVAVVAVYAVIGVGRIAGFAQGFGRGVAARPNA